MAYKVLVVDDDPFMHRALAQYLGRAGYQVCKARNGREALAVALHDSPNLIVMDVRMEEMDGLTALRKLKETEATKAIPVIVTTVNADHLTQLESEVSGAALFLTKPFSPAQLLTEIKRLLPPAEPDDTSDNPRLP